jgi:prepilin-type N-terminal cleavage/methylation domain-containing protein
MTKRGFTLMELLVSVFITGMVMLSLVAMWKTSSNHTVQAQRQAFLKNENTIFLRTFYNDFVSASEVFCLQNGPIYSTVALSSLCQTNRYVALKDAVLSVDEDSSRSQVVRLTRPVCSGTGGWGSGANYKLDLEDRCVKPQFVVYDFAEGNLHKCHGEFLTSSNMDDNSMSLSDFQTVVNNYCPSGSYDSEHWEILLPYVKSFYLALATRGSLEYPEIAIDYFVEKKFDTDAPPILFRMKRFFVFKRGI